MFGHYSYADSKIFSSQEPREQASTKSRKQQQLPPAHKPSIDLPIQSPDPIPEPSPGKPSAQPQPQPRPRGQLRSGARARSRLAPRVQTIVEPDVDILAEPPLESAWEASSPEPTPESPIDSPILPPLEPSTQSRTSSSTDSSLGSPVSTLIEPRDKLYQEEDYEESHQETQEEEPDDEPLASPHAHEDTPKFFHPFARPSWTPTPLLPPSEAEKVQELWRPSKPPKKPAAAPTPILSPQSPQSPADPTSPHDAICSRVKFTPVRPDAIAPEKRSFSSHADIVPQTSEPSSASQSSFFSPVPPQACQSHSEAQLPTYDELEAELAHTNPLHAHPVTSPTFGGHTAFGRDEKLPLDQLSHNQVDSYPGLGLEVKAPGRDGHDLTLDTTLSPAASDTSNPPSLSSPQRPAPPKATASEPNSKWFHHLGQKTSTGINNLAHKIGGTGFLPDTLEIECEKASIILRTFCRQGVYADSSNKPQDDSVPTSPESKEHLSPATPHHRFKSLVTIPTGVIEKAVGLAIFTTFRAGLNFQGATGSGILVSRLHDGSWSPPSAIQLHSFGGGIVAGINVYDCVCVINTQEALSAFMDTRVSLGADVAIAAGPWGAGGAVDWGAIKDKHHEPSPAGTPLSPPSLEVKSPSAKVEKHGGKSHKKYSSHVFSYVQSRGFYAGFAYDSTVIQERKRANAAFYGEGATCEKILRGKQPAPEGVPSLQTLFDVLRGAEGMLMPTGDGPLCSPNTDPVEELGDETIAMRLKPRVPPPTNQNELPPLYSQVSTPDSMEFPGYEIATPPRQDVPPLPQKKKKLALTKAAENSQPSTPGSATSETSAGKPAKSKAPKNPKNPKNPNALYPSDFSLF